MGSLKHEAVVAGCFTSDESEDEIKAEMREFRRAILADEEIEESLRDSVARLVIGPVVGVDGYVSFGFMPDCGEKLSALSKAADRWRARFIRFCQRHETDGVHVAIPGDSAEKPYIEVSLYLGRLVKPEAGGKPKEDAGQRGEDATRPDLGRLEVEEAMPLAAPSIFATTAAATVEKAMLGLGRLVGLAISPDGRLLAIASPVGIYLYDAATLDDVGCLARAGGSTTLAFSPDGRTLASGCAMGELCFCDVASGRDLGSLTGHAWNTLAFSPDGRALAAGDGDNKVKLWDLASGSRLLDLTGHKEDVYAVAFSPDGTMLASAGDDSTVTLWDAASGRELRVLTGHKGWVTSVAFSPDGTLLASGSLDGTVRLWGVG